MRRKKEVGQAFILVLILLAIGAVLVVPALRLTDTILGSTKNITDRTRGLYACEAAQEQVMWMLYHGTLVAELPHNGDSKDFTVDVCGASVDVNVVMRAVELKKGVILATEHTIMPTKTVNTGYDPPDYVPNKGISGPFTYTIAVTQESTNNTEGLDRVYDIISTGFEAGNVYKWGTSEISNDGINWTPFDNPLEEKVGNNQRLRWPNPATYGSADFSSPFHDFQPGQTKYLRFKIEKAFNSDPIVVSNWVMLKVGNVLTLSGPQAPIWVKDHSLPASYGDAGAFAVTKTAYPTVVPPRQSTLVTYTVTIINTDKTKENFVYRIEDYLPPGFVYNGSTTTVMTTPPNQGPSVANVTVNDVERQLLVWDSTQLTSSGYKISPNGSATLTFTALAEQGISGNYYNEVILTPKNYPAPSAFNITDPPLQGDYSQTYSWNTGIVIVPAYDSEANAEGVTIDANLALSINGVDIISWDVR